MDGSLHFTLPSMNRLNQTKPVTFSILSCLAFLRDSLFHYNLSPHQRFLFRVKAVKSRPLHSIKDVQHDILVACLWYVLVLSIGLFLVGWFQYFSLGYWLIVFRICGLLLTAYLRYAGFITCDNLYKFNFI
jgi:hypothetical protein